MLFRDGSCGGRGRDGACHWGLLARLQDVVFQNRCVAAVLLLVVAEPLNEVILGAWDSQAAQFQFLFQLSYLEDEKPDQFFNLAGTESEWNRPERENHKALHSVENNSRTSGLVELLVGK